MWDLLFEATWRARVVVIVLVKATKRTSVPTCVELMMSTCLRFYHVEVEVRKGAQKKAIVCLKQPAGMYSVQSKHVHVTVSPNTRIN